MPGNQGKIKAIAMEMACAMNTFKLASRAASRAFRGPPPYFAGFAPLTFRRME